MYGSHLSSDDWMQDLHAAEEKRRAAEARQFAWEMACQERLDYPEIYSKKRRLEELVDGHEERCKDLRSSRHMRRDARVEAVDDEFNIASNGQMCGVYYGEVHVSWWERNWLKFIVLFFN